MFDLPYADWPLYVVYAQFGSIGFIDEVMGCYRVHAEGFWSGRDRIRRTQLAIQTRTAVGKSVA